MPNKGDIDLKTQRNWSAWKAYAPRLHRFLISKLANKDDASDLMQEAYLRLIRIEKPELIRHPEVYLFRIASNLVGEFFLKRKNNPRMVDIEDITDTDDDSDQGAFIDHISHRQDLNELEAIFADLPPLYREVILLRKRDGLSHEEIAERLHISPNTVHKYITRALAKCRASWVEKKR
ncbi:RNA polymerase sigma factor [Paremcibacter congregatus]|uniref:RNA polymerase subunit sigma-70 n=1 Tax=Paremcibacter congregatus TaxID=2043170 RepID=A0A2G4YR19_9PROT|nr:RNA polymerase sigma factor [Paremcibacter congregatus]PHZ84758.1 RNA polymerase subunit sigma-70 [Paremcibacter congregatus]QDE28950.1 RNA polymerase sigma factor [Paremcibacter congregatus]